MCDSKGYAVKFRNFNGFQAAFENINRLDLLRLNEMYLNLYATDR